MLKKIPFIAVFLSICISGCVQVPDSPAFRASDQPLKYMQDNFDDYIQETQKWLKDNRSFISNDRDKEINANAPFELKPVKMHSIKKGVLLVHGLGDSPYSFIDIAPLLAEQGFLVRVILLPGHGSKPADLLWAKKIDWVKVVEHHKELLQAEVDEVWLGGFSTGGNLVTNLALEDESIKGLILFSPGFEPQSHLLPLASVAARLMDWADIDAENNYVRYDSLTFNAAGEYYKTSKQVKNELNKKAFDRPAIITMSEDDSVINAQKTLKLFETRFIHPDSKFVWYGKDPDSKDSRVSVLSSYIPEQRISSFSHMAVLFSPMNQHYGINGVHRICNNDQEAIESQCQTEDELWFSAFGYVEENRVHARLTWNPYFHLLALELKDLIR